MRKFLALSAAVLGLASCQTDHETTIVSNDEVDFSLAVGVTDLATRAGDSAQAGRNSAYGAIDYLQGSAAGDNRVDWADVDLRYTLEVYDVDPSGNYGDDYAPIKDRQVIITDEYTPVNFELRLIPNRDYHFVVFADFVEDGASDNPSVEVQSTLGLYHNIGATLKDITLKDHNINTECTDAYFASSDIAISNPMAHNMTLWRPYGKVRVVATDLAELNLNTDPGKVAVEYNAFNPSTFNALTGAIGGEYATKSFEYTYDAATTKVVSDSATGLATHLYTEGYDNYDLYGSVSADGIKRHTHMTLFTDYILADDQQRAINFTMAVYDKANALIKQTDFNTDIPVQRNYLTTLIGNVLTYGTEVNITINDNFHNSDNITEEPFYQQLWDGTSVSEPALDAATQTYTITKASELAWLATADANDLDGKTILLAEDIDLNNELWTPIGTSDNMFKGTLDGNGKTIYNLAAGGDNAAFIAYADAGAVVKNLTLEGVTIDSSKYAAGVVCNAEAGMTIDNVKVSGTINATSYAAGICHDAVDVTITNCQNDASVTANRAAGVASWLTGANTVIDSVVNNGDITGQWGAAGIANRMEGAISNAVNNGEISSSESEPAAGIVCIILGACDFEYCYNYGDVRSMKENPNASAAGILGQTPGAKATFAYCANFGDITAEHSYAAGIAYSLYGTVTANYCYNNGAVSGARGAGGIAPKAQYGSADKANYCLNGGFITSSNGLTYQASNNNVECFYYANGDLLNVSTNNATTSADALALLNGGTDANFFELDNGTITVK
jgi:hypothetical protein